MARAAQAPAVCSSNHASTVARFSLTQLMLARVRSSACSSARVPEPNPMSWLSSLNCSSCQAQMGLEQAGRGPSNPWQIPAAPDTTQEHPNSP